MRDGDVKSVLSRSRVAVAAHRARFERRWTRRSGI